MSSSQGLNISIHYAQLSDAELLSQMGIRTYHETYSEGITQEDTLAYLEETFSVEKVCKDISDPIYVYFIAFFRNRPAGFAKMCQEEPPVCIKETNTIELRQLYV